MFQWIEMRKYFIKKLVFKTCHMHSDMILIIIINFIFKIKIFKKCINMLV